MELSLVLKIKQFPKVGVTSFLISLQLLSHNSKYPWFCGDQSFVR